jgi:hypothetical protein
MTATAKIGDAVPSGKVGDCTMATKQQARDRGGRRGCCGA